MIAETHRVEFVLGHDTRLLRAVGGAIAVLGGEVGFDTADVETLGAVAEAACEHTFPQLPGEAPELIVTVETFSDRLEITLAHHGESTPAVGLETLAGRGGPQQVRGPAVLPSVDRLQYDSSGGMARTRLVKYLRRSERRT